MKKIFNVLITLCFFVNISFAAFDPYADEEIEEKSNKKLYYGIVLTLLGGFLAYDGFSKVEVDTSKPNVDYSTVLHSEWNQYATTSATDPYPEFEEKYFGIESNTLGIKSGMSEKTYKVDGTTYGVENNILYNNGNVDLYNITIEVRYKYNAGRNNSIIPADGKRPRANGTQTSDGYHIATVADINGNIESVSTNINLKKGQAIEWQDLWGYTSTSETMPNGNPRTVDTTAVDDITGLNLGENALTLMDVRVVLNKNQQYKPIYEKRNKSDIEGVCGILIGAVGIYFIVDHFLDMHKFNVYAKRHDLNLRIATAPNEYKLMLQKRI